MNLAQSRAGILVLLTTLLQACGGGGGGDNGGGGNGDGGRLTVSTTSISVSAEPGEATPTLQIDATIQNPAENLWAYVSSSNNGIQDAWFEWTSSSTALIHLNFKAPHEIENDRYEDDIQFYVCPDSACNGNISGSPARIHAIYDIEGGTSAALSANHVESVVDARDEEGHREIVLLDLERPLENPEIEVTTSNNAVAGVHPRRVSATQYAGSPCNTHLASYQASTLARGWVFALQPMTIGGTIYPNLGQHVFHDATNGRKYLISHLEGMADQAAAFYLSVVE